MRKLLIILFCLIIQPFNINVKKTFAKSETATYAKALSFCTLYKTSSLDNDLSNIYFIIPESYFVVVLDNASNTSVKVQYDKYIGYVSPSTINVVTFIPKTKTLNNISFDIKDTSGTQIWNIPSSNGKVLTTISASTKNINYIAAVFGEIPSGGESNLWFYISYTPEQNSTNFYEGYVYSENITNLTEIVQNTETDTVNIVGTESVKSYKVSSLLKTIIIALISIPLIIFLSLILYKMVKIIIKNTNKDKNSKNNKVDDFSLNYPEFDNKNQNVASGFNQKLKHNIDYLSRSSLKKISRNKRLNQRTCSNFTDYDSDDDLL